jgi:hypothetical protein
MMMAYLYEEGACCPFQSYLRYPRLRSGCDGHASTDRFLDRYVMHGIAVAATINRVPLPLL